MAAEARLPHVNIVISKDNGYRPFDPSSLRPFGFIDALAWTLARLRMEGRVAAGSPHHLKIIQPARFSISRCSSRSLAVAICFFFAEWVSRVV